METSPFSFTLMFLILNTLTLTSSTTLPNPTIDQEALISFKNDVVSDPENILSRSWLTNTSICDWAGVTCGLKHHRVTALNLTGLALAGTLSPHLGNLTFLQSLDIKSNFFTGSIPSELSNLRRLKVINAASNNLTGEIPSRILTNMSSLIKIDVRYNKLSGQLPNGMCHNTPNLRRIVLTGNQISGEIPASIGNCRGVEDLWLEHNQFSGNIPSEIGNLSVLINLALYSNYLEGAISSNYLYAYKMILLGIHINLYISALSRYHSIFHLQHFFSGISEPFRQQSFWKHPSFQQFTQDSSFVS